MITLQEKNYVTQYFIKKKSEWFDAGVYSFDKEGLKEAKIQFNYLKAYWDEQSYIIRVIKREEFVKEEVIKL